MGNREREDTENREREVPGSPVIRTLRAEEIECRVSMISEKGLSLLLFKDARVDQKILDETFTPFGWKRSHQEIAGNLYCTVEIWDQEKREWVGKQDVGTVSYSEKEKGQASDSFKRACFNWGVGRELYTAPFIWIPAGQTEILIKKGRAGEEKYYTNDRFQVRSISYDEERSIDALVIVNTRGKTVYAWEKEGAQARLQTTGRKAAEAGNVPKFWTGAGNEGREESPEAERSVSGTGSLTAGTSRTEEKKEGRAEPRKRVEKADQKIRDGADFCQKLEALEQEMKRTGVTLEKVLERYQVRGVSEMTAAMYRDALSGLRKTGDRTVA